LKFLAFASPAKMTFLMEKNKMKMDFDNMGVGEILEAAEDLGWEGCYDLQYEENQNIDVLEEDAIKYIKERRGEV